VAPDKGQQDEQQQDDGQHEEGGGSIAGGVVGVTMSSLITAVGSILTAVIASRLYGITVVGEFALVIAPWAVLVRISTIAEHLGFMRVAAVLPVRSRPLGALFAALLRFSTALTFATSILTSVVTALLYNGPIHRPHLVMPAIVLVFGYLLFDNVGWNLDTLLTSTRQHLALFYARISQSLAILAMTWVLAFHLRNVWGLTLATLFGYFFPFVVRVPAALKVLPKKLSPEDHHEARQEFRKLLHFSKDFIPNSWMAGISGQSPTLVLGAYGSDAQLGVFSRAAGVTGRLQDIVFRMGANVVTYLSRAHAESRERFVSLSRRTITLTLLAIGLPVTILFGSARAVLQVFGTDFTSGRSSLRVLAVAVLLSSICSAMTAVVVVSVNRATILAWSGAGTQLVGVLVSFPLVRQWGALGASYAQLCAAVLAVLAHFFALSHSNNLTVLRIPIIKIILVLVVGGGLSAALDALLPHPVNLVVTFLVVPVVFLALCLTFDLLPFTAADLVARIKQRVGRGGPTQPLDSSHHHEDDVLPGADPFVQPDLLLTKD
jgi:O-antigen/teichoic acid export membrane protein